jgi:hypothetical protein
MLTQCTPITVTKYVAVGGITTPGTGNAVLPLEPCVALWISIGWRSRVGDIARGKRAKDSHGCSDHALHAPMPWNE